MYIKPEKLLEFNQANEKASKLLSYYIVEVYKDFCEDTVFDIFSKSELLAKANLDNKDAAYYQFNCLVTAAEFIVGYQAGFEAAMYKYLEASHLTGRLREYESLEPEQLNFYMKYGYEQGFYYAECLYSEY